MLSKLWRFRRDFPFRDLDEHEHGQTVSVDVTWTQEAPRNRTVLVEGQPRQLWFPWIVMLSGTYRYRYGVPRRKDVMEGARYKPDAEGNDGFDAVIARVFARNGPVKSLTDKLYHLAAPHVSEMGEVCLGDDAMNMVVEGTVSPQDAFWLSDFVDSTFLFAPEAWAEYLTALAMDGDKDPHSAFEEGDLLEITHEALANAAVYIDAPPVTTDFIEG